MLETTLPSNPIPTAAGELANTSCMAFGQERIALALINVHGPALEQWPVEVLALLGGTS